MMRKRTREKTSEFKNIQRKVIYQLNYINKLLYDEENTVIMCSNPTICKKPTII